MNTSTIAVICGAAIASAGVTYYVTSASPDAQAPVAAATPEATPKASTSVSTPSAPSTRPSTSRGPRGANSPSDSSSTATKPDGIDDETWAKALERAKGISSWANRARESGWMERRMKDRVERDAKTITDKLGIEGAEAEKIQDLLSKRMEASTDRARKVTDAMLSSEEGLATLLAVREMKEDDQEVPASLEAAKEAYKKEMFGEFYPDSGEMADDDIMRLFRPSRPQDWYKDDEFLVSASTELGGDQGASLMDYAGKMDYLDRQDDAFNKVNRIERSIDLQPQQSTALKKLYTDNPSPTDEQISQIVGPDKVESVKSSSSSDRRRGGWGGGRRGGR